MSAWTTRWLDECILNGVSRDLVRPKEDDTARGLATR